MPLLQMHVDTSYVYIAVVAEIFQSFYVTSVYVHQVPLMLK